MIHDEAVSGFFRLVALGESGLIFSCGKERVAIPLPALWKLVEQHDAAFVPPKLVKAPLPEPFPPAKPNPVAVE